MFMYVGTYTEAPSGRAEGIYVYRFDPDSGALSHVQTVPGVVNPSFLALDLRERHLYAVNEVDDGGVSAFARDGQSGECGIAATRNQFRATFLIGPVDTDSYVQYNHAYTSALAVRNERAAGSGASESGFTNSTSCQ